MGSGTLSRLLRYLPVLLRGHPLRSDERYRPFFILGAGRSGTTLLRAMLEAHPDVHIPPENPLEVTIRDYRRYSRLPWTVLLRIVLSRLEYHATWDRWDLPLGELYRALSAAPPRARSLAAVLDALYRAHLMRHKPSAIRWGDKTPPNTVVLPELRHVFPDLRVIHALRDGRDVVRSFMEVSREGLPYFAAWWVRAVARARAFGARWPAQYLEVRYEDLVRDPAATIRRIAAFLELAFDERMLRHSELDLRLGDVERYRALGGVREPIHERSIGRWRTEFDAGQIAELERVLGPTLAALGYRDGLSSSINQATPT